MKNQLRIVSKEATMAVSVKQDNGSDLSETSARDYAERHLRDMGQLGGWGGDWYFSGTHRTNYDTVEVIFKP